MKKQSKSSKTKQYVSVAMLVFTIVFFVALIVMKDSLLSYVSNSVRQNIATEITDSVAVFIDSTYNYSSNGRSYEITFLEFGATGCIACRKMETVMEKVKQKYPDKVNVVFLNILKPENQMLMKYYGVAAIPTQVLLNKDGKEFFRHTGYYSSEEIIQKIKLEEF